ncbi:MAP-ous protein 1 [Candida viswanathii]|uniref:MAP-ous protein 1 n=1 Tax=Candida viswanathii TaxID=5486 RepID=A0A367YA62_9ASCO|nr:MAP-ous protein 1 [Candida viswanathii]
MAPAGDSHPIDIPKSPTSPKQLFPSSTSPASPLNKSKPQLEMEKMRDILEEETNLYTKGVTDNDVDWIVRDSSIDPNIDISQNSTTTTTSKESSPNVPTQNSTPATHLSATISNSNDNYTSKTKPSIAPIQEENVASDPSSYNDHHHHDHHHHHHDNATYDAPRRRSSTSSIGGGLFSKLKSKFRKDLASSEHTVDHPKLQTMPPPTQQQQGIFKSGYDMNSNRKINDSNNSSINTTNSSPPKVQASTSANLLRTMSTPVYTHDTSDPRLEEYIKFYQRRDSRKASVASSNSNGKDEPLPLALVNGFENANYNRPRESSESTPSSTSKISGFLKRRSSTVNKYNDSNTSIPGTPLSRQATPQSTTTKSALDSNPSFKGLKPLKRVAFHSSTFLIDPPQQIPSRTPRKGNVEVLPNGTVKIRPLTEEEKIEMEKSQRGLGGGIIVGGTGALGYVKKDAGPPKPIAEDAEDDPEEEEQGSGDSNSDGTSAAGDDPDENEPSVDAHAKGLTIDKPMAHHQPVSYSAPVKKMALDTMYARCCHLREILPIPAIMKQIPKGSMAPLPVLQMRNPTPTMIEIQSFADFLRIAPVICVCLDGVNFSVEQFKILLSAMSAKKQLEKLSLRNTPLNEEGWSLLCWFLSRNTVLNKLDITQCPSLSVNILKKKKKKTESKFDENLTRMTSNKENRSDVDWELFVATLIARGGIEELILTGCCIQDIEIFEKLMSLAVLKRTSRLGLAFNQLTPRHMKILVDTWLFKDFARGIDLGYNDFLSVNMLKPILDYTKRPDYDKTIAKSTLSFMSINSTNSSFNDIFKETVENFLMRLPNLKYLDFSNNQRLFGIFGKNEGKKAEPSEEASVSFFISKLPLFPQLIRLHLENENFSQSSVLQIAEILPFCQNLGYFSILGTKLDTTCATALVNAVKNSKSLINLECDTDDFPNVFKDRIGLYTMRNMEKVLYSAKKPDQKEPILSEGSGAESLTDQLHSILALKSQKKLDLSLPEIVKFVNRAKSIRHELRQAINELLKLQLKNTLELNGKETLIRLIFIDSSIEKGLQLIDPSFVDDPNNSVTLTKVIGPREGNDDLHLQLEHTDTQEPESAGTVLASRPLSLSKNGSRTSLTNLSKEEASVLKLSKLRDFHRPNSPFPEAADFRQKLMSFELSDLDKVIEFLSDLKREGISLEKVFESEDDTIEGDHDFLNVEEIKSKLASLKIEQLEDVSKEKKEDEIETTARDSDDKREFLNTTYDQVLNNLTK